MAKNMLSQDFDFEDDYQIIEVTAQSINYSFIWLLNHHLKSDFHRMGSLPVYSKTGKTELFDLFAWSPTESVYYYIVYPSSGNNLLISTAYILIQGIEQEENISYFIETMNQLPDIFSAEKIDFAALKHVSKKKNNPHQQLFDKLTNIISDLEIQLNEIEKENSSTLYSADI